LSVNDKCADGFSDVLVKWDNWMSEPDGERIVILAVNMKERSRKRK
jgi:hypothetical protein